MRMQPVINKFLQTRRNAVAIMFALCLLPLVLLVGLAIDTAFYSQARTQAGLAAEAAATHAVRVAANAYTLDISNNESVSAANTDAILQGNASGALWFQSQLGPLLRASASLAATNGVNVQNNSSIAGANGAGFTGTVTYTLNYPPIFSALFGSTKNWTATANATAQTDNKYVEVLLLIDTSNSMLLGADQSDITLLAETSACPESSPQQWLTSAVGLNPLTQSPFGSIYESNSADSNALNFNSVAHYTDPSLGASDTSGTCQGSSGSGQPSYQPATISSLSSVFPSGINTSGNQNYNPGAPLDTCSLACHTVTTTVGGYYQDLYGMARRQGAKLRLDVVISATENVIQDLYNNEQSAGQFTVGVYQFNTDVAPMVQGISGTDANTEATADLVTDSSSALYTIQHSYDYSVAGNASLIPALTNYSDGNTFFSKSVADLISGKTVTVATSSGTTTKTIAALQSVTTATAGSSASNPEKDIFIVTDGFEDEGTSFSGAAKRYMGEMTSYKDEGNGLSSATCESLKLKGLNVYVLYVVYYPIPHITYYTPYLSSFYSQTDAHDFSQLTYNANSAENVLSGAPSGLSYAEVMGTNPDNGSGLGVGEVGPDTEALEACASPGDFYEASSSTDINNAMQAMLRSAISSSITVTQ